MVCKKHGKDTSIYCEEASCKKAMSLYLQKHHKNHDIVDHNNEEIDNLSSRLNSLANDLVSLKTKILATKEEIEENKGDNTL